MKLIQFPIILVALFAIIVVTVPQSIVLAETQNETVQNEIDRLLADQSQKLFLPGVAATLIKGNNSFFGQIAKHGDSIEKNTPFIIGSISKSYTAIAVMQLVQQGRIDLDASVVKYIPEFSMQGDYWQITIRNLLNHTSGISTLSGEDSFSPNTSIYEAIMLLNTHSLSNNPGNAFQYSNANYRILGLIIERTSGISYAEYIQKNVFQPLQTECSYTSYTEAKNNGLIPGYKTLFGVNVLLAEPYLKAALPSGFIISCTEDLNKLIVAILQKDPLLLDSKYYDLMFNQTVKASDSLSYGFGWYVAKNDGQPVYRHGGDTLTYHSLLTIFPNEQSGFAFVSNTNSLLQGQEMNSNLGGFLTNLSLGKQALIPSSNLVYVYIATFAAFIFLLFITARRLLISLRKEGTTAKAKDLPRGKLIRSSIISFFLAGALMFFVPRFIGANVNIPRMFNVQPDLTSLLILGIMVLLIDGIWGLFVLAKNRNKKFQSS